MFYWLIELSNTVPGFGIFRGLFNVFRYITFRTGGAMVTGALFVFLFGPWIIDHLRLRQGKGQPIRTDGPQSHLISKKGTPTMGGLMILSGLVVSTLLWANPANPYVWIVLAVTLGFGFVGFYDDYLKVTKQSHGGFAGKLRLAIEAAIALAACYALVRLGRDATSTSLAIPFFKDMVLNFGWFFVMFGAFVMVGAGNAVNLTDGLDGLAIVPVMIAAVPGESPWGNGGWKLRPVYAFACKAASSRGTNLLTQNIFLLPLTTTTSPARSSATIFSGSSVAGSSCQPRPLPAGSRSYR